jgi:ribosomal protein S18 acetylase RimI-like enzyme
MDLTIYNQTNKPTASEKQEMVDFLFRHLEKFGDPKQDIEKAIGYAVKDYGSYGGFVLKSTDADRITCVVVVNRTGMEGYIPENILVYIATHKDMRGRGIGKKMMQEALNTAKGSVALHVEPDNPAKMLYEKLGFTNKYLEMRYFKN